MSAADRRTNGRADGAAAAEAVRQANVRLCILLSSLGVTLSASGRVSSPSRVVRSDPLRARAEWTERAATAAAGMAMGMGGASSGRAIARERARREDTRAAQLSTRLSMATGETEKDKQWEEEKNTGEGKSDREGLTASQEGRDDHHDQCINMF